MARRNASFFGNVVPKPKASKAIKGVRVETLHKVRCGLCSLDQGSEGLFTKLVPSGPEDAEYYILGEAPGEEEAEKGSPFAGRSGRMLRQYTPEGCSVRIWNNVRCKPPGSRAPDTLETECCRKFIEEDIQAVKPSSLLLVGGAAFTWATGVSGYRRWLGMWFPVQIGSHVCWAMVVPHPDHVQRQKSGSFEELKFNEGMTHFFFKTGGPERAPSCTNLDMVDDQMRVARDRQDISKFLGKYPKVVTFDLETTSDERGDRVFRPYGRGCEILCMAFSRKDKTLVIPAELMNEAVDLMESAPATFVAHNLGFDLEWLEYFYPGIIRKCEWGCTAAQAYVLHEGPGKSLNDLAAVFLGLRGLKEQSGVDVANLRDAPKDRLHRYCARDAFIAMEIWKAQANLIDWHGLEDVYGDQLNRILPAVLAQNRGVCIAAQKAEGLAEELEGYIEEAERDLKAELNGFRRDVDMGSSKDVAELLEHLGFKDQLASEDTKSGRSTGDAILETIDHPVIEIIKDYRSLTKLLTTYVDPLSIGKSKNLWPDGRAHPKYNVDRLATRRSSCDHPNIQNQPKRNPEHSKLIRDLFIPCGKGRVLLSMDYGQIEARVVAMASKDDFLVNSIKTGYDIHAEWAERILKAYPKYCTGDFKEARTKAKGWVFGNLFGSTIKGAVEHVGASEAVVRRLYGEFWEEMPGVKRWHEEVVKSYEKDGYVELLTGFRRHGPLRYNEIINTPVQGSAFDIVCDAWFRLFRNASEQEWLFPAIQIHDDLTFEIPAKGVEETAERIAHIVFAWDEVKFPFINVPLTVEMSVGERWGSMEEIAVFNSDDCRP